MTRDNNNQRRDNVRPFSRHQSSGRPGDERSPRPARPRLNRETVDRAWESGAPPKHADYRARTSNGQPPQNNWRNNQQSEHSSAQNGRKPFGNRQDNNRRFDRTPNGNAGNSGSRSRSFGTDSRTFDGQRSNERRSYTDGPNSNGGRPASRNNFRPYEQRSQQHNNTYNPGSIQRNSERFERQPREFGPNDRDPRSFERQPREFDRNSRPARNGERSSRPSYPSQQRDNHNPRWQSRPQTQQQNSVRKPPTFNEGALQKEQFEGDYERFDTSERPSELQVTRLPDGRVLKGPRPVQRQNAQFWANIAEETGNLIDRVETVATSPEKVQGNQQGLEGTQDVPGDTFKAIDTMEPPPKARARAAKAVTRGRKTSVKQNTAKPGAKPSQRGYKWPTA